MKKKLIIGLVITLFQLTCFAEKTILWSVDLSQHIGGTVQGDYVDVKSYSDGSVAGIVESSNGKTYLFAFFSDGTLKTIDPLPSDYDADFSDHSSNPDVIALSLESTDTYQTEYIRLYEYTNEGKNYTVSTLPSKAFFYGSFSGVDPTLFFRIDGSTLIKYRIGTAPVIDGSVASGINGSNYIINWNSIAGMEYQIQSSTNLIDWVNVGSPISGTGESLTWANALTNSHSFYRVIKN